MGNRCKRNLARTSLSHKGTVYLIFIILSLFLALASSLLHSHNSRDTVQAEGDMLDRRSADCLTHSLNSKQDRMAEVRCPFSFTFTHPNAT